MSTPTDERRPRAGSGVTVEAIDRLSVSRLTPLEQYLLGHVPSGTVIPLYGSTEFNASDDLVLRVASVIRAAAAQRLHRSPEVVAEDLRRQLVEEDEALWQRIRCTRADIAASLDWRATASSPTWAELQRRRAS